MPPQPAQRPIMHMPPTPGHAVPFAAHTPVPPPVQQPLLLQARLAFAAARGIELAMVVTAPGSASHRNAERSGFRPVYTRAKWQRAATLG